ncbi:MAG: C-terminal helicase domain-containing protein, partial [Muribaculaceae bacterium]|nr:C-terminal helicase domain-containing protein [Muribaculaceae bacterium]
QKPGLLKHLFNTYHSKRVIVFAASKLNVKELARDLKRTGWKTGEMHSDLDQADREKVMLDFKSGRIDILVATDIVARGIDIDDITMVVNYDVPREAEDYVHRIGRTARAGTDGKAVTLVGGRDQQRFGMIENFLGNEVRKEPVPEELGEAPEYRPQSKTKNRHKGKSNFRRKNYHNRSKRNNKSKNNASE